MRSGLNSTLRTRLVILVLLAVVPALGLILHTASEQRRTATLEAREQTLRLARLAANNQKQVVEGTRQLLMILAQIPVVRQGTSAECNQLLADILKQHSAYANFAVVDIQGNIICSGIRYSGVVNTRDRSYFQRAVQSRKFAVGEYQISRSTKKPTLNFAYPILDKAGRVQTVVIAALDLVQLNQLAAQIKMPEGSVLSLIDQKGTLLVRYPNPQNWVGKYLLPDAFTRMKRARGEGIDEITSLDGVQRIFAFVPVGDNPLNPDGYIRIGIPKAEVLADANRLLVRNLISLGAVTFLAIAAAWIGGDVFFLRQIKSLVQTAKILGSGELNTRTGLSHISGEFGELAQAIDEMAAAMQAREMAIASLSQNMQTLFELIPIGILITEDMEFQEVKSNPAFAEILGISPDVNAPPPAYKILRAGKELSPEEYPLRYAALHNTELKGTEVDIVRGDGSIFNLFGYAAPLRDQQGNSRGAVAAFLNITERKQTEERTHQLMSQVQHQANILNAILSASVDHIYIFDRDGRYQYVSEGGAAVLGWIPEDMVGKTWQELHFAPEAFATMQRLDIQRETVMATGQPIKAETEYTAADGVYCYEYILAPLYNPEQAIAGVIAVSRDISERQAELRKRKQTEQALRQSEQRLRLAQRAGKIGTWEWNLVTGEVSWSEGIWDILGLEIDTEKPGLELWVDFIHPDDRPHIMARVEKVLAEGKEYYDEFRIIRRDYTVVWLASKGQIIRNAEGQAERFLGVNIDISERKQAEEVRKESEERFQAFMAHSPAAAWITDVDGQMIYLSPTYLKTFQVFTQDAIGKNVIELFDDEIARQFLNNIQTVANTNQVLETIEIAPRLDGTLGEFLVYKFPIAHLSRQMVGGVAIDVTARRKAEAEREELLQREQAAREAAETANRIKDEFLAVLSHELRTPLNPILGWIKLLRTRPLDEEKKAIALETIERNAKLQTQLIGDLLDISRILQGKLTLNISQIDLTATIAAAIETVALAAEAKSIHIYTHIASDVPLFTGDASRLQQVVWNLLTNAVKFTPTGGEITIQLESTPKDIQIQVSDTGKGITPEFLPFVFESFRQADSATTRKFGGLGLGLAIVRHIVEMHGGTVHADSEGEDKGATFTVKLPLITTVLQPKQNETLAKKSFNLCGVRVLTVEDEEDTRELIAFTIGQYGGEVTAAASASEALKILKKFQPDVLVCDIAMPEMDGYTLMRQIRTWPKEQGGQIKAIALTAYAGEADQKQALAAGFQTHLSKPVDPEELVKAIASLTSIC